MRDPIGVMRHLFVSLYCSVFEAKILEHNKEDVFFQIPVNEGEYQYAILSSMKRELAEKMFNIKIPQFTGMMYLGEKTMLTTYDTNGHTDHLGPARQYLIVEDSIRRIYTRSIKNFSFRRDSIIEHEVCSISLIAHEMRHELQERGIISPNQRHVVLPPRKGVRLSSTYERTPRSIAHEFRRYLKIYGKMLLNDREMLENEVDALATQLSVYYAWVESKGRPIEERMFRLKPIIFGERVI